MIKKYSFFSLGARSAGRSFVERNPKLNHATYNLLRIVGICSGSGGLKIFFNAQSFPLNCNDFGINTAVIITRR
jgi:hypothetical protein